MRKQYSDEYEIYTPVDSKKFTVTEKALIGLMTASAIISFVELVILK